LRKINLSFQFRYSQGSAQYTARPPTGVDLALGLSGYDNFGGGLEPVKRVPSSLQPLKDEDEERKRRVIDLEAEEAKWTQRKAEVENRRARDKQEHDNYVYEAKSQQLAENCQEAREEVSKQLNKVTTENVKKSNLQLFLNFFISPWRMIGIIKKNSIIGKKVKKNYEMTLTLITTTKLTKTALKLRPLGINWPRGRLVLKKRPKKRPDLKTIFTTK
jgi:hypothetical protein